MLSRIRRNALRLARLYRLAFADERMAAMEAKAAAMEARLAVLEARTAYSVAHVPVLDGLIADTRQQVEYLQETADALKSRDQVSPELINEFHAWKAANPLSAHPLVSVCIATYNRARLLTERCLPSVLAQTYDHLEVIVVGDCCQDDTEQRITQLGDSRLTFINLPERGKYPDDPLRRWMVAGTVPLNHAMRLAKGEFVTHLDDDDEYIPERIERLVEFAASNNCDFVWHPFLWEQEDGSWLLRECPRFAYLNVTTSSIFYRAWLKKIEWDIEAYRLLEPGDWNRLRRIKYIGPTAMRYPEPMLKHYRERNQSRG